MTQLPEPFTTRDIDVRDLDCFMLNAERLLASELWALSTGEEFKAAMGLWCRAWKQLPAGSLPDNDRILASFACVHIQRWPEVREIAMRGFVKCSDGRFYHPTLCEDAKRAFEKKTTNRFRGKLGAEARWGKKGASDDAPGNASGIAKAMPGDGQGRDSSGTVQGETSSPTSGRGRAGSQETPPTTAALAKRISGVDSHRVRDAVARGDVLELVAAFGGNRKGERDAEWLRDTDGMQLGVVAAIFAWMRFEREAIREPSGFRRATAAWDQLGKDERRAHVARLREFGLPVPDERGASGGSAA